MDFDGIKDFIDSVGDTVAVFGNEEAIRLYDEIKEIIDDWSSCDSDDIPDTVLTNLMRLFGLFIVIYRLLERRK